MEEGDGVCGVRDGRHGHGQGGMGPHGVDRVQT
jgi:hypothetical protein